MSSLLETINNSREEIISRHYRVAAAQLKEKIADDPLRTIFDIYAGCISLDITEEISHRFNAEGIKSTPYTYGIFTMGYYLTVEVTLPEKFVHREEKKEEEKEEEKKEEVVEELGDITVEGDDVVAEESS